jgi:hypothetical protein
VDVHPHRCRSWWSKSASLRRRSPFRTSFRATGRLRWCSDVPPVAKRPSPCRNQDLLQVLKSLFASLYPLLCLHPLLQPRLAMLLLCLLYQTVVPGTPDLPSRRSGKIKRTKLIREQRLLTSSSQLSAAKSSSSATLAVAQCHLVDASVVCQDKKTGSLSISAES